ncbi:MAG: hypothetical protein DHS20C02_18100 [Micavibrio sp.]|nr:MAG: hypothetical protein DHS20C02_18100 [Micavibrio sp.]
MRLRFFYFLSVVLVFVLSGTASYAQRSGFDDPGARSAGGGGGDGIVPVQGNVDGGTIPTGATAQVVVLFRNEGSQPVETGVINLYPSSTVSGSISLNQCSTEPLPSGAECAIALSVKGLQAGPWRLEMLMRHSGRTRLVTTTLSGTVESTGEGADKLISDVETIPDEVDFGTLNASQTLVEPIILRNITSNPINLNDIYIDAREQAGLSLNTECEKLEAGQACLATVTWSPQLKGPSSGVMVIKHDGPTALASVILKGEYTPDVVSEAQVFPEAVPGKGLLVSSQTDVEFGSGVETASTITVSLVNAGDAPLMIEDIKIAGKNNGLSFNGDGCAVATVLEPIEACPLTLSWSPTRVGTLLDDIQIVHNGARGILVLPVRGTASQVVSQDQKAIVLTSDPAAILGALDIAEDEDNKKARSEERPPPPKPSYASEVMNPASVLDGLRITSFAPTRAIVNGPGGSRIMFDGEEVLLGGIPWSVDIQKNGIEFTHQGQRVLLLFDRSLSSINRVSGQSSSGGGSISSSSTVTSSSDGG